jgi:hypothetical protein
LAKHLQNYVVAVQEYITTYCRYREVVKLLMLSTYEVVSESSRTVTVVPASVKEDEGAGQGNISESLLHQSPT